MKLGQRGFSLIEIMVALALISVVLLGIPAINDDPDRKNLEELADTIDRAIRFAGNEASLRNTLVRLSLNLDKNPIEYKVEFGPNTAFTLPAYKDIRKMSLKEQEEYAKELEKNDRKFNAVSEFKDLTKTFDEDVKLHVVSTNNIPEPKYDGMAFLYFYPTGEKDHSIIIGSSGNQLLSFEVEPFTSKTHDKYYTIDSETDNEEAVDQKASEIYKDWKQ